MNGMLFRFSLYGFLKNQRYFEPFLVLVFLEKGLRRADHGAVEIRIAGNLHRLMMDSREMT